MDADAAQHSTPLSLINKQLGGVSLASSSSSRCLSPPPTSMPNTKPAFPSPHQHIHPNAGIPKQQEPSPPTEHSSYPSCCETETETEEAETMSDGESGVTIPPTTGTPATATTTTAVKTDSAIHVSSPNASPQNPDESVNAEKFISVSQPSSSTTATTSKPLPTITSLADLIAALRVELSGGQGLVGSDVDVSRIVKIMGSYIPSDSELAPFLHFDQHRYTRNLIDCGANPNANKEGEKEGEKEGYNLILLAWNKQQASPIHDHADSHCVATCVRGVLEETKYSVDEGVLDALAKGKTKSGCLLKGKAEASGNAEKKTGSSCSLRGWLASKKKSKGKDERNNKTWGSSGSSSSNSSLTIVDTNASSLSTSTSTSTSTLTSKPATSSTTPNLRVVHTSRLTPGEATYIHNAQGFVHRIANPSSDEVAVSLHLYTPPIEVCRTFDEKTGEARASGKCCFFSRFGKRCDNVGSGSSGCIGEGNKK